MDCTEVYDKVYLDENYRAQFEEFRSRYWGRTRKALEGRTVDHNPDPNVVEFFNINEEADGGITLTTGDFMDYFDRRFGGKNRLDVMRRAIRNAEQKAETRDMHGALKREDRDGVTANVRSAKRRFAPMHALFALMLVLSVVMVFGSAIALNRADSRVADLKAEIVSLENTREEELLVMDRYDGAPTAAYDDMCGGDGVEVYETESVSVSALLNALSFLTK